MNYTIRTAGGDRPARIRFGRGGLDVTVDGRSHRVAVCPRAGATQFTVTVDATTYAMTVVRSGQSVTVVVGPDRYEFVVSRDPAVPRRGAAGSGRPSRRDIPAPMPGLIKSTSVRVGDSVEPGRLVAVMEAMKMQMEIRAPEAGRVLAVLVRAGEEVARGAVLVTIETTGPGTGDQGPGTD
ncbi:MAG TPA: biotin/lipoyl-containing protein [bacterium]|nr:biotin/lipoyl-containing protein [bacterium]